MKSSRLRRSFLAAVSSLPVVISSAAYAQDNTTTDESIALSSSESGIDLIENAPSIVVNDNLNPYTSGPGGALDTGVNGVGQMIGFYQSSDTGAGLGLCTGTLINPRTVIFAAHCVNSDPAAYYGSATGTQGGTYGTVAATYGDTTGIPLSFGFASTNRCQGVAVNGCASGTGPYEQWRDNGFNTQTDSYIYNVNQV